MNRRPLTSGEARILSVIQEHYGSTNTDDEAFVDERNEAIIFVEDRAGSTPVMANLTLLSEWRANGTIATDEELLREWLRIG
jgi:hypothetical protein